jgi:hypothetical protein
MQFRNRTLTFSRFRPFPFPSFVCLSCVRRYSSDLAPMVDHSALPSPSFSDVPSGAFRGAGAELNGSYVVWRADFVNAQVCRTLCAYNTCPCTTATDNISPWPLPPLPPLPSPSSTLTSIANHCRRDQYYHRTVLPTKTATTTKLQRRRRYHRHQ